MRKKNRVKLYSKVLTIVIFVFLNLGNCLAFGQENTGSKEIDINKFRKEYQTSEFNFEFKYLCDETIDHFLISELENRKIKKEKAIDKILFGEETRPALLLSDIAKRVIGNNRVFLLKIIALKIAYFDETKLVFVQGGKQFNVEKDSFDVIQGKYERMYPETFVTGFLYFPPNFDPTITTTIWYKEEKLGTFVIPDEYRDLIFALRKPCIIKSLNFKDYSNKVCLELILGDNYGASTISDGMVKFQLYSLKEEKLLYEEERKVLKADFSLNFSSISKTKSHDAFLYRWYINYSKIPPIDGKSIISIKPPYVSYNPPNGKIVISFTLPSGKELKVENKCFVGYWLEKINKEIGEVTQKHKAGEKSEK